MEKDASESGASGAEEENQDRQAFDQQMPAKSARFFGPKYDQEFEGAEVVS